MTQHCQRVKHDGKMNPEMNKSWTHTHTHSVGKALVSAVRGARHTDEPNWVHSGGNQVTMVTRRVSHTHSVIYCEYQCRNRESETGRPGRSTYSYCRERETFIQT